MNVLWQVYSLHIETWKWSEHTAEVEGEAPSPRYGHAAVALPDDRHVATFGGGDADDDMFFSSITLLDTLTWRWSTPKVQVQSDMHDTTDVIRGLSGCCITSAHNNMSACL